MNRRLTTLAPAWLARLVRDVEGARWDYPYPIWAGVGFGIGPVVAGKLFDVGRGQWIWIGSLMIGPAVAAAYRAFGPLLRNRQTAASG
ncbi:MAG TPA: hypothetical protein VI793_19985 [Anaerolineales bacterium]|nr:hypothetical protein [Anaerolineales bacterium]